MTNYLQMEIYKKKYKFVIFKHNYVEYYTGARLKTADFILNIVLIPKNKIQVLKVGTQKCVRVKK